MNPKNKKINGKVIAEEILNRLKRQVKTSSPTLAIILVGNDPASKSYVEQKILKAKSIGVKVIVKQFVQQVSEKELLSTIEQFNNNSNIAGIIVQRPLPVHIDTAIIDKAVDPKKDVDGFSPNSKFDPPLAAAVLKILEYVHKLSTLQTKKVVVIGKGETGGGPIITALTKLGIKPIVTDSKTTNPKNITKTADIIISAVGKEKIITGDAIKKGVVLISIGLSKNAGGKLVGDYDEDDIKNKALFYTPTPGGVGPVNVACLLENLVKASSFVA